MNLAHLIPNNNQFFTGGLFLGAFGAAAASLRAPIISAWSRLINWFFIGVEVLNNDPLYEDLQSWLGQISSAGRFRQLSAYVDTNNDKMVPGNTPMVTNTNVTKSEIIFSAAPGTHFVVFEKTFIWVTRSRIISAETQSKSYKETLHLRIFCLSSARAKRIIKQAVALGQSSWANKVTFYGSNEFGGWDVVARQEPRRPDSVILADGQLEELINDSNTFRESSEWYRKLGIPYRRGYLLYGPPGNGKTSTVASFAGYFGLDIFCIQLSSAAMTDAILQRVIRTVPPGAVILFEDIDALFKSRDEPAPVEIIYGVACATRSGVTLSGLLNIIDGVCGSAGRIIFMTTNYRERLDPALIRPGRMDYQIELKNASPTQATRMLKRFFPEVTEAQAEGFGQRAAAGDMSMAQLQQHLMAHRDSLDTALAEPFIIYNKEENCSNHVTMDGQISVTPREPSLSIKGVRSWSSQGLVAGRRDL